MSGGGMSGPGMGFGGMMYPGGSATFDESTGKRNMRRSDGYQSPGFYPPEKQQYMDSMMEALNQARQGMYGNQRFGGMPTQNQGFGMPVMNRFNPGFQGFGNWGGPSIMGNFRNPPPGGEYTGYVWEGTDRSGYQDDPKKKAGNNPAPGGGYGNGLGEEGGGNYWWNR